MAYFCECDCDPQLQIRSHLQNRTCRNTVKVWSDGWQAWAEELGELLCTIKLHLWGATPYHLSCELPLSGEEKEQMCKSAIDTVTLPRVRFPRLESLTEWMRFSCFVQKQNISHTQPIRRHAVLVIQYGIKSRENWEMFISPALHVLAPSYWFNGIYIKSVQLETEVLLTLSLLVLLSIEHINWHWLISSDLSSHLSWS